MSSVMPSNVNWVHKAVASFDPDHNTVTTADGDKIKYDFLVVAAGLEADIGKVKGLQEALDDPASPVATIYDFRYAAKAWDLVKNFKGGKALFTMPSGAIKCGGAPVKITFLSEDYWRKQGVREKIGIEYCPAGPTMFAVKKYGDELEKLRRDRYITGSFGHELVAVDKGGVHYSECEIVSRTLIIIFAQQLRQQNAKWRRSRSFLPVISSKSLMT